ncbi:hypothetical protein LPB140_00700 [Sphingorhabdus lutea]|uniref:SAM-dependent MTase RsmB/NOP-type domain-containing protein n=1 Tax=Sphingorhabdus lutea TaxID=1913578 RepID=A0A1L3J903_9SPHN|nr:transcription antitermination factor NusB [Sphingorhabdus lutea]APG61604.1 hypothetical protein LPB140_00700 [Sphingorhabdus lutea]
MEKQISGLAARTAALQMLDAVLRRGEHLDQARHAYIKKLNPSDAAMAMVIANETLRYLIDIDALIDSQTRNILSEDAKVRMVLRMSLAQLFIMETPPHAVISTSLALLQGGPRKLAHGVIGSLLRAEAQLPDTPTMPPFAALKWLKDWGPQMVEDSRILFATAPSVDLCLKDAGHLEKMSETLAQDLIEGVKPISLMAGHIRMPRGQAVDALPGFDEGEWWVQDIAAQIPARILNDLMAQKGKDAQSGDVLDLCAAPGGKTMQLCAAKHRVTALDVSERRARRLQQNLDRTAMDANIVIHNLLKWKGAQSYDAILLDAPCTASGTFRRHPDIIQKIDDRDIAKLAALQSEMFAHIAKWVRPGGFIIFATCSLEREEGEDQLQKFLSEHGDFTAVLPDMSAYPIAPINGEFIPEKGVRVLPNNAMEHGGMDGFYVAAVQKNANMK